MNHLCQLHKAFIAAWGILSLFINYKCPGIKILYIVKEWVAEWLLWNAWFLKFGILILFTPHISPLFQSQKALVWTPLQSVSKVENGKLEFLVQNISFFHILLVFPSTYLARDSIWQVRISHCCSQSNQNWAKYKILCCRFPEGYSINCTRCCMFQKTERWDMKDIRKAFSRQLLRKSRCMYQISTICPLRSCIEFLFCFKLWTVSVLSLELAQHSKLVNLNMYQKRMVFEKELGLRS